MKMLKADVYFCPRCGQITIVEEGLTPRECCGELESYLEPLKSAIIPRRRFGKAFPFPNGPAVQRKLEGE